jgi:hypothetical protein
VTRTVSQADIVAEEMTIVLGSGGGGYAPIYDLAVEVRDSQNNLLPSASLTVNPLGNAVITRHNDGTFTVDDVYIHNVLTASAPGFNPVSHTITAHDADTGLIVIRLGDEDEGGGGYAPIYGLVVNVVDNEGNLLSNASLTVNRAAAEVVNNNNGTFILNGVYIHDILNARALGFVAANHTITAADAYAGVITITLEEGLHVFFDVIDDHGGTLTVTAYYPDGTVIELTESGLAVPRGSRVHFLPTPDLGYQVMRWYISTPLMRFSDVQDVAPRSGQPTDLWLRDIQVHTRVEVEFGQ